MAKNNRDYEARMGGMRYALEYAKEKGLEELEKDINKRGFLKAPIRYSDKEIDNFVEFISKNLYSTMLCVTGMTLRDQFGFGKSRLIKFRDAFSEKTETVMSFDWLGNHYATMEDYAIYLNEKFDLGIDVERISACQDVKDRTEKRFRSADINRVLSELKENGFEDAARFLERKM